MRNRISFYLAALAGLAGCAGSDVTQTPADNTPTSGRPFAASQVPNPSCPVLTVADVNNDITNLFVKNAWPDQSSTKGKFKAVQDSLDAGNITGARTATRSLIAFINNKWSNLTTAEKAAAQSLYDKLIADLWCFVGISGQVFDLNPGDPIKAFDIPGIGGVQFPANVVPVGTIVSLTDLTGQPCPLSTGGLDCFPGYLSISLYPNVTLSQPATVVLCPPSTVTAPVAVGHQDATTGFELLPLAPVPPLLGGTCSGTAAAPTGPASWFASLVKEATRVLMPKPLEASSVMMLGGVGGITTKFSPFAVVGTSLTSTGGTGGTATKFAPPAGSPSKAPAAGAKPEAAPVTNNPALPSYYVQGAVGSTTTSGLPSVTISTLGGDLDGVNKIQGVTVTFTTSAATTYDPDSDAKVCDAQGNIPASNTVSVVTDANGVATLPCLAFGNKAGYANLAATFDASTLPFPNANQVTVTANDGTSSSSSLNWLVQSNAGLPTKLGFVQTPSTTAQAGVALGQQPSVQLYDALGNEVYTSGIVITAAVTTGGGTATYTAPVTTGTDGVATFSNLAVGGAVAGVQQTLSFTFPGIAQALTSTLQLTAGPAAQVVITAQPSSTAQAGVTFAAQPAVAIKDQYGNLTNSSAVVTAELASGGVALAGGTTATASGGVATFSGLRIDGLVGARTLQFRLGSITSAPTNSINVQSGPPSQIVITQQPGGTAPAGQPLSIQPIITVLDQFGNPVTDPVAVTAFLASGPPILAGTTTVNTVNGVATFTDLRFDGPTGDRTLQFSSGNLTSPVTNNPVTVTAGSVAAIRTYMNGTAAQTFNFGSNLVAFTNTNPAPQVLVTDTFGNPVPGQPVYWSATTSNGGLLTVGATGTPTNAQGLAQAASWMVGDGLNQAIAGLFAPGVTPTITGYLDAVFSATTPTGVSVWACAAPPTSKTDVAPMSIKAPSGTMKKVTLQMSVTGTASALSSYPATLVARLNGPTGTILGTSSGTVELPGNNGNPTAQTFTFPTSIAKQSGSATIWFGLTVTAPSTRKPQIWYNSSTFKSTDPCFNSVIFAPGTTTVAARGLSINVTN